MYHPTTRVLTVLELLQAHGRLSGPELAARLEVNARTIRHYITLLQDLGIPVEAERGRHGAYRLRPGFKLPPLMFTEEEAVALTLGLLAARRLGLTAAAPATEGALAKVEHVLPDAVRAQVQALQSALTIEAPAAYVAPASSVVVTFGTAAQQRQRVRIAYRSWGGEATERAVDTELDWFAHFLAGLGCPVVVRSPPELRDALRQLAKEIAAMADSVEESSTIEGVFEAD